MTEIDELNDTLHQMFPISLEFREDLKLIVKIKPFKNRKKLLKAGKKASKAWKILSGSVIAVIGNLLTNYAVKKIYFSGDIVTDMESFFINTDNKFTYYTVGEVKTLELKKKDFLKLSKYPEAEKLVQHIMLLESAIAMKRADLIAIQPSKARIRAFVETHVIEGLPDAYIASYLAMTEEEFTEEKYQLLLQDVRIKDQNPLIANYPPDMAYKVKFYLKANFAQQKICTIDQIAGHLFTTAKTIGRTMKKTFGLTVHQYLIKLRMEHARQLLSEKVPVKKVAEATGYADQATFSKIYKKYYRYPPKDTIRNNC